MIKVYFQTVSGSHSKLVATFATDELYNNCLSFLEDEAAKQNCIVTESEVEDLDELVSHLDDAVCEIELNLNIVDEEDAIEEYKKQINSLNKIKSILNMS